MGLIISPMELYAFFFFFFQDVDPVSIIFFALMINLKHSGTSQFQQLEGLVRIWVCTFQNKVNSADAVMKNNFLSVRYSRVSFFLPTQTVINEQQYVSIMSQCIFIIIAQMVSS